MGTKFKGLVVALDKDIGPEDADELARAISCLRGVAKVERVESRQVDDFYVREQVRMNLGKEVEVKVMEIMAIFYPNVYGVKK